MKRKHLLFICLSSLGLLLTGCMTYSDHIAAYRNAYTSGDTARALEEIESLYESDGADDSDYNAMLLSLEASQASRLEGIRTGQRELIEKSQAHLARVDRLYNEYQRQGGASIFDYTASTLTVPDAFPYLGSHGEAIMASLYQMLTAMQLGDVEQARMFATRLYQRQKESVAEHSEDIAETRENLSTSNEEENSSEVDVSKYATQMDEMTTKMRESLPDTRGYDLYVNPFAEYLIAFYHYHCGRGMSDLDIAQQCIRRVLGMNQTSKFLKQELACFTKIDPKRLKPTVYLIHESGLAPFLVQESFMLPLMTSNTLTLIPFAYPILTADKDYSSMAALETNKGQVIAEEICNVEAIFAKEFEHTYASRLTHALIITLTKSALVTSAQVAAKSASKGNDLLLLGTMLLGNAYIGATNIADTRVCNSFPRAFSMARTTIPQDGKVKIKLDGRIQKEIQLPSDGRVWVIYMRSFHRGASPIITYFKVR